MLCSRLGVSSLFGVRSSHSLYVPYVHHAVTALENGIPKEKVRELRPEESQWDFWTSSEAFQTTLPRIKKVSKTFGALDLPFSVPYNLKLYLTSFVYLTLFLACNLGSAHSRPLRRVLDH